MESALEKQKSNFPLKANAAVKQMENLRVEIGNARPKLYECINLATSYQKSIVHTKGYQTLGDVDDAICDFSARFRDCLSKLQDYVSDILLTKMETDEDFQNYDKYNVEIEELRNRMSEIPASIYYFQKDLLELENNPEKKVRLLESLMNKHRAEEKQNIDMMYNKLDLVCRYFHQLCKPQQSSCRI